jgi:hypothetical protein
MDTRIIDLTIAKIIQEYTFLKTDEELKRSLIDESTPTFLELINTQVRAIDPALIKPQAELSAQSPVKKKEPKLDINGLDNNTRVKLKKIYREIVKHTHPDKVDSAELAELYIKAKDAYEDCDLFELYFIAKELKLNFKLTLEETRILNDLIDFKKDQIKKLEDSFIWQWMSNETLEAKQEVVTLFIKTNYLR